MHIIGHAHIIKQLQTFLSEKTLPHALLFVGPHAVGKRRVADWLASQLLPDSPERVLAFSSEELGIDAVRLLRKLASLSAPAKTPHIIIIDGVARLSAPAANALLKTLEEPRGAIHFLLIADGDGSNILPTIRSRSSIFRFAPVELKTMMEGLQHQLSISNSQAKELARASLGAPGRAILLHANGNKEEQSLQETFIETIDSPLVDRFALVKEVVDNEQSGLLLSQGLLFLRDVLLFQEGCNDLLINTNITTTEHVARSLVNERLRSVLAMMLAIESMIATSNVNQRLALEEAMIAL